jgi:hypothetical protein
MSSVEFYDGILRIVEKYGVAIVLSTALMWILRNDILLPLVDEHRLFVRELGQTQKDIGRAIAEQTVILARLQDYKVSGKDNR